MSHQLLCCNNQEFSRKFTVSVESSAKATVQASASSEVCQFPFGQQPCVKDGLIPHRGATPEFFECICHLYLVSNYRVQGIKLWQLTSRSDINIGWLPEHTCHQKKKKKRKTTPTSFTKLLKHSSYSYIWKYHKQQMDWHSGLSTPQSCCRGKSKGTKDTEYYLNMELSPQLQGAIRQIRFSTYRHSWVSSFHNITVGRDNATLESPPALPMLRTSMVWKENWFLGVSKGSQQVEKSTQKESDRSRKVDIGV